MTSDETIKELQNALKRERIEKKIYKTQIEQYKQDLEHRDRIIERLRAALSTRHKIHTTHSPVEDAALFGNSVTFNHGYDEELSSRTSIELKVEDAAYNHQREQQSSQDHTHAHPSSPEYGPSQSALSDVTTDILSSVLPTTPRSRREQNSQTLAAVKTPRRPRATCRDEDRYPGYAEHPSPSLRACHGKAFDENESLDLQQVQGMAFTTNQQKSQPFESLLATALTQPADHGLPIISKELHEAGGRNDAVRDDEGGSQDGYIRTLSAHDSQEPAAVKNRFSPNNNQTSPIPNHTASYLAEDEIVDENSIPYDAANHSVSPQHAFAYVDVVRNKYERSKMHGTTCACCSEFYRAVGTLPDVEEPNRLQHVSERIKKNSRHREVYKRPQTPPGYWDVEFPSSQELKRLKQNGTKGDTTSKGSR